MTADLVAFLQARLDEEEAEANAAADVTPGRWRAETYQNSRGTMSGQLTTTGEIVDDRLGYEGRLWDGYDDHPWTAAEVAAHSARHDPARVLADVQAKRAILQAYDLALAAADRSGEMSQYIYAEGLEKAIELLANAHADHPDYQQEWSI